MTGASDETQPAMCYPTKEQYEQWKDEADEMGMTVSEYMQSMIEAGRKKFDREIEPDQDAAELRMQRNDMKRQLESARRRIEELEEQLHGGERAKIIDFISNNPGATWQEIVQEVGDTVPNRVRTHLAKMEGQEITRDGEQFYPTGGGHE